MTIDGMGQPANVAMAFPPMGMGGYGGGFGYGGDWWAIILLAVLFGGFGGGYGGFGGGNGALGMGAIYGAQQFSQLDNGIRSVQNGICDSTFALNNSINAVNTNLGNALCTTTYELASKIDNNRFASQQCCCETQRAIDGVKFGNAQNTCDIINAIHAEGEATRAQLTQNTIQTLRDKLNDKDRDIQTRDFQLSQLSQNSFIINNLKQPTPVPAYVVANPYCCQTTCGCNNYYAA